MLLVIGPTCAGKSTYIRSLEEPADGARRRVHFGHQLRRGRAVPSGPNDVVHLNLLAVSQSRKGEGPTRIAQTQHPEFVASLEAAERVVVIGAPRSVLIERAAMREGTEPDIKRFADNTYRAERWSTVLQTKHLAQYYEQLALALDGAGKPVEYLCSNHPELLPVSRWQFPLLATDAAEGLCAAGHPAPDLDLGPRTYQADYRPGATGSKRSLTLGRALQMPLADKRVLDIGCAEGAAALSAARMGAEVTGLEPKQSRIRKARAISQALGTPIELHRMVLDGYDAPRNSFDVVLALNVIHHVHDPFAFLDRAADLTRSHLVLEYPGLGDRKFAATVPGATVPGDDLPLMGVSLPAEQDQTYVYTPAAFERYLVEILGVFGHHEVIPSPIPDRWISVFSQKRRRGSRLDSALAREAELRRRIADLEASRSWKLTAPLRRLGALRG
ncbi:methyltransferase domain-containing protein [Nocardioides pantholopis]|uniref:methyltransferase domain-containing protein n=1 Tax=Nocardioides pantholopis TaxID=2483798 RepID=UPI000F08194E|nr:methyltransferase domain-containing protein [Nocardioides pantholopis]